VDGGERVEKEGEVVESEGCKKVKVKGIRRRFGD
jgi:hypothetical protein